MSTASSEPVQLKAPSPEQFAAYGELLRMQRWSFDERRSGRSGLLSAEQRAAVELFDLIVCDALNAGVGFDVDAYEV